MRNSTTWIAATLVLGIAGCSDDSKTLGSVYIKKGLIGSSAGGSLAVTQADCVADSAKCPFVGTSIVIPRGALSEDTDITILPGEDATGRDGKVNGPALDFGPDGIAFSSPVEITIPVASEIEKDLLRVYVTQADGTKSVLMPYQLAYDRQAKQVRFLVSHFTTFQCGEGNGGCSDVPGCNSGNCTNGACNDACDPADCGPQPGIPSWICDDGSAGGFTGVCERQADGSCGWVINNCNPGCGGVTCPPGSTCDPANNGCVNDCTCPDGQPCTIDNAGVVHCGGGNGCDPNTLCPDGSVCDPATGMCGVGCVCPDGQACTTDPDGQTNCGNAGCNAGVACPPGSTCDPATGTCSNTCTCPDNTPCAVDSAGNVYCGGTGCDPNTACPPGSTCDANGQCIGDCTCPDGQPCTTDPNGTVNCQPPPACDPTQCGPQPGLPNWTCENGQVGGPTGNCLPTANGTCGWEIIWCDPACDADACNGQPPPSDPANVCPDGTIPPYVCDHDENGACAWTASCGSNSGGN